MVDSGTLYRRATAQMLFDATIAITTSARSFGGYLRPRWLPATVFLQYARFFVKFPPPEVILAQPVKQKYLKHFPYSSPRRAASTATVESTSSSLR